VNVRPIAVVYLARQADGLDGTQSFVRSYRAFDAGLAHELIVVLKGFDDPAMRAKAVDAFDGHACRFIDVEDRGYDLTAYFTVARSLDHPAYLFLNTSSRLLDGNWLAKYAAALRLPGVGLAGATASYESHWTNFRGGRPGWHVWIGFSRDGAFYRRNFDPFPNPHVRTNAFMIARETLDALELPLIREKKDAYCVESGKASLTRQIRRLGLEPVVVDRTGKAWKKDDWPMSQTFRLGEEENLLVADNQTDHFLNADAERRAILSRFAWGPGRTRSISPASG
jgi:hypothetical protein